MPIGILGSLVICTILYIIVVGLLTGLESLHDAEHAGPGGRRRGVDWGDMGACALSILVRLAGLAWRVMLVMILGQTRVLYLDVAGRPAVEVGGRIHPRFRTPWIW